jgi:two-component system, OmpR family, response regulator
MIKTYIVEDSPVILDNLIATLEETAPVKVLGHADGERAALAWLQGEGLGCDLVIVDLFLREGSGIEVLKALEKSGHPATRVVLSNYATPETRQRCLALGASRVFDKSSELDALIDYCQALGQAHRNRHDDPGNRNSGASAAG